MCSHLASRFHIQVWESPKTSVAEKAEHSRQGLILLWRWNFFGSRIFAVVTGFPIVSLPLRQYSSSVSQWINSFLLSLWLTTLLLILCFLGKITVHFYFLITWWPWLLYQDIMFFTCCLWSCYYHGHTLPASKHETAIWDGQITEGHLLWKRKNMKGERLITDNAHHAVGDEMWRSDDEHYWPAHKSGNSTCCLSAHWNSLSLSPSLLSSFSLSPYCASYEKVFVIECFLDTWPVQPRVCLFSIIGSRYNHIKKSDSPMSSLSISLTRILPRASEWFTTPLVNSAVHYHLKVGIGALVKG